MVHHTMYGPILRTTGCQTLEKTQRFTVSTFRGEKLGPRDVRSYGTDAVAIGPRLEERKGLRKRPKKVTDSE